MTMKKDSEILIDKESIDTYIHLHLPNGVHITLNLNKDYYTREEADDILAQALETWEYIKTLRK